MSQFFFAWVPPGTPWSSALQRWDENIVSFSIEHAEGDIPSMTMIIKNPYVPLLSPSRLYWGWLAWEDDTGHVHLLFYGRLVGVPTDTLGEAITLKFSARPPDYIRQKQKMAETLKVAPGYDRVFMPAGKLDDPDVILEGYSLMYHVDRLTGLVSVSDILIGEDGQIDYGGGTATYASLKIRLNQPPLMAIAVQATANWDQQYRGWFDVINGSLSTFTGEAFISDWPTTGKSLGGGYHAAVGWAANADGLLQMATSLGTVTGGYSWQNLEKKHQNGDTMSLNVSYSHNVLDDYFVQMGGIKTVVWQRNQIGILDAYAVDANGDPAPINIPAINEITWMTVVPWNVAFDLTLGYEANRKRSEFLFFTLNADAQPIITDPLITEDTEVLSIQTSNLSAPEITFLNWDSVSGQPVAEGTVVFPNDPSVPGQTSSQIATIAGTAGTVEPTFSNIAGAITVDGASPTAVVWTSLGSTPPAESAMDWNRYLNIARGTLMIPLPMIADNLNSVLQPGVLTFPPHGVFINQYRLLTDGVSAPGDQIFECETAGMLVPAGQIAPAPPPVFNTFNNPSGQAMYICTGAGQTGEYHTTFNESQGATTRDGTVTWTSIGAVTLPIGGWPGMTPARSYFPSDRGLQSVQHLISRARAKLRKRARAVQLTWECPFIDAIGLSCRMNASISDARIPGGSASGKVIAYKIIAQGNTGRLYGEVTIGCTVGNAGSIAPNSGTPEYVQDGVYVDQGYQLYNGQVVTFGADDVGFTPPVEQAVDDGIVFPLDYNQAVLVDQFNGSQDEEIAAVKEAIFLAQEAAYNKGTSTLTIAGAASTSVSYSHPDYAAIQNTMRNANLLGAGLWYELSLKPLTNGPFSAAYSLTMTDLALPKTIDLTGTGLSGVGGGGPSSARFGAVGLLKAVATGGTSGGGTTSMSPPSGYTTADLIFEDKFTTSSLNTANWNPFMGLNGIRWQGTADDLPYPYSAIGNLPGGDNVEYGNPYPYGYSTDNGAGAHMVLGGSGLQFIASPDTHEPNYTWAAAYVSGTKKLALMPATGGYLQIRARMPDSTHGGWGSLWMLAESPGTGAEMDLQETGFTTAGIPVNQQMASSIHTGPELFSNVGVDISADFHIYGLEYIPGVSVKTYFDGALQQHWTTGVSTGAYEVILSMTMWGGNPSVHTLSDPVNHPGPYTMIVSDVQIYRYPP